MHSLKIGESPISLHRAYPKICKRRTKCIRVACPASPESMLLHVFRPPSTCSPIEKHQWWHVFTGQDVPRFAPKNSWLGHRHLWGAAHRDTPIASSLLCFTISGWITCTMFVLRPRLVSQQIRFQADFFSSDIAEDGRSLVTNIYTISYDIRYLCTLNFFL